MRMKYCKLGQSGAIISRLCLGTMNFGMLTDANEANKILDCAVSCGINFVDTSNSYGGYESRGLSESIIGQWLRRDNSNRNKIVLATKVYSKTSPTFFNPNDEPGLSILKIKKHLTESMERLQTDYIDLLQFHHIDRSVEFSELYDGFYREFLQGRVNYLGTSNYNAFEIGKLGAFIQHKGTIKPVSEQHRYSLMCRLPELEVLPAVLESGMTLLAWGPLHEGRLCNHATDSQKGTRGFKRNITEQQKSQLDQYQTLCNELHVEEQVLAIAWLLLKDFVCPVIGPRTVKQLENIIKAIDYKIDVSTIDELERIFPGPGGYAPEAYAW